MLQNVAWRKRLVAAVMVAVVLAVVGMLVQSYFRTTRNEAETALATAREQLQRLQFGLAINTLAEAKRVAESVPGTRDLVEQINDQARLAHRGLRAQKLHDAVLALHYLSPPESLPRGEQQSFDAVCQEVWQERALLLSESTAKVLPLLTQDIRLAIQDFAILWSDYRVRIAPADKKQQAHREALERLVEIAKQVGDNMVLDCAELAHARALGLKELPSTLAKRVAAARPQSFWDHFGLGRCQLAAGRIDEAARSFEASIELLPKFGLAHFFLGVCRYRQNRQAEAIAAYRSCLGESPYVYFYRGLAHAALGHLAEAEKDFDLTLKFDTGNAPAYFQRGLLSIRRNDLTRAAGDFHRAEELGGDAAACRYQRAFIYLMEENWEEAAASLRDALDRDPDHVAAQLLLKQLPPF